MKLKNFFYKLIHNKKVICICVWFLSMTFCFISGAFSPFDANERAGYEMVESVSKKDNQFNFITVESKSKDSQVFSSLPMYRYFSSIYGKDTYQYLTTYNANKIDSSIYLSFKEPDTDLEFKLNENLSIISAQANSNYVIDNQWKHEYYDFNLMFPIDKSFLPGADSNVYITKKQADFILNHLHSSKSVFEKEDYLYLINKIVKLTINSTVFSLRIWSIIEENNFYSNVIDTIGAFVVMPTFKSVNNLLSIQHCFVINDKLKQNINKINYLKSNFPIQQYSFKIGSKCGEIDKTYFGDVYNFLTDNYENLYLFIIFAFLSVSLLIIDLIFVFKSNLFFYKKYIILFFLVFLISHLIFALLYFIFKSISLYSLTSITMSLIFVLIFGVVYVYFCKKNNRKIQIAFWKK